jgi:hypothetical protein
MMTSTNETHKDWLVGKFPDDVKTLLDQAIGCHNVSIREYPEDVTQIMAETSCLSYGDLRPIRSLSWVKAENIILEIDSCGGSDYSGGSANVSNYRRFLEMFGDIPGVFEVSGGFNTYTIAVAPGALTQQMIDTLAALCDYPLISDEDHSAVEIEAQNEAWHSWLRREVEQALNKRLSEDFQQGDEVFDVEINVSEEDLLDLTEQTMQHAAIYWRHETGNQASLDVERVAEAFDLDALISDERVSLTVDGKIFTKQVAHTPLN